MGGRAEWRSIFHRLSVEHSSLILVALAWLLPFFWPYRPLPIGSFYSECLAFGLGLAALVALAKPSSGESFPMPTVALAFLALAALILAQDALGLVPYSGSARAAARYLAWATMLSILGAQLRQTMRPDTVASTLAWFLFAAGLLSSLIALIQLFQLDTPLGHVIALPGQAGASGNLGQAAHFASYMALAMISAGYLYARGSLNGAAAGPCIALFVLLLVLTGRRAAWLYVAMGAVIAWLPYRSLDKASRSRLRQFGLFLFPVLLAALWAVSLLPPLARDPAAAGERLTEVASGIDARIWLAQVAMRALSANPIIGAGWNQYGLHHFEAAADWGIVEGVSVVTRHSHNLVLQLLAETGIAGAGIVLSAACIWLLDLRRARFDLATWWVIALLGVIGIHSMIEYPLWYAYFLGIAAVLVGLGATRIIRIDGRAGVLIALGVMVYGAYVLLESAYRYRGFEQVLYAASRLPAAEREPLVMRELERNRDDSHLAPYVELIVSSEMAVSDQLLGEKLQLNSRLMRFAPVSHVVYRQAMLLALSGDAAGAERQLRRAAVVYPDRLAQAIEQLERLASAYPRRVGRLLAFARSEQLEAARRVHPG